MAPELREHEVDQMCMGAMVLHSVAGSAAALFLWPLALAEAWRGGARRALRVRLLLAACVALLLAASITGARMRSSSHCRAFRYAGADRSTGGDAIHSFYAHALVAAAAGLLGCLLLADQWRGGALPCPARVRQLLQFLRRAQPRARLAGAGVTVTPASLAAAPLLALAGAALPLYVLISGFWRGFDCYNHRAAGHGSHTFVAHEVGHTILAAMWLLYAYLPFLAAMILKSPPAAPSPILRTMRDCGDAYLLAFQALEGLVITSLGAVFFVANNVERKFALWRPLLEPARAAEEFGVISIFEEVAFRPPDGADLHNEGPAAHPAAAHAHSAAHAAYEVYRDKDQQHLSQASLWMFAGFLALVMARLRHPTPVHFVVIGVSQALMNYFHAQTTGHGMLLHQTHVIFLLLAVCARMARRPVEFSLLMSIAAGHFLFSSTCFMETSRALGIDGVSESIVITVAVVVLWSWQCLCWLDAGGGAGPVDGAGAGAKIEGGKIEIMT